MKVKSKTAICVVLATALLSVPSALAQQGAAEVRGVVTDPDGNPMSGVTLVFTNPASPDTEYTTETNKKGRFYISNLLYYANSIVWDVRIDFEGHVPTAVKVESRTQAALVDKFEQQLKPGQDLPDIPIRAFGKAVYDVVLTPADQVAQIEPEVVETVETVETVKPAPAASQSKDPWDAAVRAAADGDLEGAVPLLEKALEKAPDDAERLTALAKVQYQLERYGDAVRTASRATAVAPESLDSQMVLYSVYVATDNLAGAGAALERAREIAPDDRRVLSQAAFLAEKKGDTGAAIEAHEAITRIEPDNSESWIALGGLYAEQGKLSESEAAYQKVAKLDPESAYSVFYNIGALIMNRRQLSEADHRRAAGAFRRAIEIKPDYAPAHQQLAFALLGTGDLKGAGDALKRYLELAPKAPDAADMKALLQGLTQ